MAKAVTLTTPWGSKIKTTRAARFLVIVENLDTNGTSTGAHIERGSSNLDTIRTHMTRRGLGDWTHRRIVMDRITGEVV